HCTVTRQGNQFILTDLDTKSGTSLNKPQNRLTTPQALEEVSEIFLGSVTHLRIELLSVRGVGDETLIDQPQQDGSFSQERTVPNIKQPEAEPEPVKAVKPSTVPIVISVVSGPDQG